jgi:CDGSH-type Zn-finger protein
MDNNNKKIVVSKNGPYLVTGKVPLDQENIICDKNGNPELWEKDKEYPVTEEYRLCRCGQTKNKPFCSGEHLNVKFNGEETAGFAKFADLAEITEGPELDLADAPALCASAGFCHRHGGTWANTEKSDKAECKKLAIEQAGNCPSGRLVAYEKSGEAIEPQLGEAISLVEYSKLKVNGPLWVKGGIEIESGDGRPYEKCNRVTLCRCGKSNNKPFCDSSHLG